MLAERLTPAQPHVLDRLGAAARGLAADLAWALEMSRRCEAAAHVGGLDGEAVRRIAEDAERT